MVSFLCGRSNYYIEGGHMAKRKTSTRYRICERADQAINLVDRVFDQLQAIDELQDDRSYYIITNLPLLIVATTEYKNCLTRFKEGL